MELVIKDNELLTKEIGINIKIDNSEFHFMNRDFISIELKKDEFNEVDFELYNTSFFAGFFVVKVHSERLGHLIDNVYVKFPQESFEDKVFY